MATSEDTAGATPPKFRLHEHPWAALLAVVATTLVTIIVSGTVNYGLLGLPDSRPIPQFVQNMLFHILTGFVIVPLVLRLPRGKRPYRRYLEDIGLGSGQPWLTLIALALGCYVILAICQAAASVTYRLAEGLPVTGAFLARIFDLSGDLPPKSWSVLTSLPSAFEEVAFRGVVLTVFLGRYTRDRAITVTALAFGLIHLLNLGGDREAVWVLGQVVWATSMGIFYGYVFTETRSLLPSMIVHFLGNAFIGSLTGYLQSRASAQVQALYGVTLTLGVVPTAWMVVLTRYVTAGWPRATGDRDAPADGARHFEPAPELSRIEGDALP